ncbi:hypothetical protein LXA43DRAFT_1033238 [Ganoderma leucocontextum]|nr:hypothetical protein LXA43DRAFT_1033238 [Ganoderma leucocontextum]
MPTHQSELPKKDEEIWFDDGNIVVVAGDTAFRLYKGGLSFVSPVFKDLFSVPQPEIAETMDGCPVVRFSDSPSELRHFFRLVAKPAFSFLRHDSRPSFRMLAAICRIGHKYQATEAVEVASERIVMFFQKACSTAITFSSMTGGWESFWECHQRNIGIKVELTDAIEAINLARLLEQPDILPFAFYLCCAGHPLHLRNGIPREDGTLEKLTDEDYVKCVLALPQLLAKCVADVRRLLAYYKNGHGRVNCQAAQRCQDVFRQMDAEMEGEDPIGVLLDLFVSIGCREVQPQAYLNHHERLCLSCLSDVNHGTGLHFLSHPSILTTYFSS